MKNPSHPRRMVRQDRIEPLGLTIAAASEELGVSRRALNNLANGRAGNSRSKLRDIGVSKFSGSLLRT